MKEVTVNIEDYLKPTATIDCDNQLIKDKARNLTKGVAGTAAQAKSLFYWVRDGIAYTPLVPLEIFENYRASETLKRGKGFCVEKAAVLAALARAVGIPARLHFADIRNHLASPRIVEVMGTNLFSYHGYTELYIDGNWIKATPAFDLNLCREKQIVPVEFDGQHHALFYTHNRDGRLHIEYLKDHGHRIDVPVQEILTAWLEHYGIAAQERLNCLLNEENRSKNR